MSRRRKTFQILANNRDIDQYKIEKGPVSISYTMPFAMMEAREAAGITVEEWEELPGIPLCMADEDDYSKAHIITWWKYRNQIEAVNKTAQNREFRRRAKRGGKKG